jgi:hypothetical protein
MDPVQDEDETLTSPLDRVDMDPVQDEDETAETATSFPIEINTMTTQKTIKASTSLSDRLNEATTQDEEETSTFLPVRITMTTQDEDEARIPTSGSRSSSTSGSTSGSNTTPPPPPSPLPPPPPKDTKDKMKKTLKKLWTGLTTLTSMVMYVVDVISDMLLAVRYFRKGDRFWGGFTTAFISIPWALLGVVGAWQAKNWGFSGEHSEFFCGFTGQNSSFHFNHLFLTFRVDWYILRCWRM